MNIRNILSLGLCLSVLLGSSHHRALAQTNSSPSDTLRLTMQEALKLGLEQSTKVQVSVLDIQRSEEERRKSLGGLFPQINLNGSYSNMLKKQRVYFGSDDAQSSPMAKFFPEDGIEMGQTHSIQGGLQAGMPLVAPQLWASLGLSAKAVDLARERSRGSRVALRAEIRKAYLAALLATEVHETLQASHQAIKQAYEQISLQYDKGLVAEYDKLRMGTQEWNIRTEVFKAQKSVELALMKLKVLMALPIDTPLKLRERLEQYASELKVSTLSSTEQTNLSANTLLGELGLQQEQLEQAIKVKKMAFLPTLSANFVYQYSFASDKLRLDNSRRWSPFSTLGLSLSVPLFSGGSRTYDLRSSRTQLEQLRLQRQQAERELNLAAQAAKTERNSAYAQYIASAEAVKSAERGLVIAQARYRVGESTLVELNDAELALRQARLGCSQAIHSFMAALYSLEELEGQEEVPPTSMK